jgi:hypothetical protein
MYERIKALGFETVAGLIDLKLTGYEAENLLERLYLIDSIIADLTAKMREPEDK